MTKADKFNAVAALAMMVMLALMGHRMQGNSVRFDIGFPALMWLLWFWLNRARAKPLLVRQTAHEVVFERPTILRSLFGFGAAFFALLMVGAIQSTIRDEALYNAYYGLSYSLGENVLLISFLMVFVGLPALGSLWLTGSYRVLFDLDHYRYCFTGGLPFLPKTVCGGAEGGVFYVRGSRRYALMFRPAGHRHGYLLEFYATDDEARTQAHRLADKLNLTVERRDENQKLIGA